MLERWIYKGVVDDPFGEFMVREDLSIQRDLASKLYVFLFFFLFFFVLF